ncbi:hypothetical protein KA068_00935 [Candidatus Saccharibacteria bacterium]|nr:hypothetical protein [Candidatus Saccharibacteria bacterium]
MKIVCTADNHGKLPRIYLLDLRKIPADSDSFSERPISLSFVGVSTGTPPEDRTPISSLKPKSEFNEVPS